ncbi:hypothetical protein BJX68DRAFT_89751 [Aspergillus pseudodeflectus]|uniref:Uncharacterized protein n=1 Tax=Aspergillus pseudodeflectus TaxID=176178 RepID=A0ABR4L909_9EURO
MASNDKGLEEIPDAQIESNYDEVTDSFDSMDLKSELLRGMCKFLFRTRRVGGQDLTVIALYRCLRLWFRTSLCYPAACHHAHHQGQRCHCSGSVRYWKDRYFLHLRSPEARPQRQGLPGSDRCPHP